MQPVIIYCYDAYCGWCYGFSPVISNIARKYADQFHFEVLSGGMIPSENPRPISATAGYISEAYKRVEELTGITFGKDYLWHIFNPDQSDWFPHSEKAAIALCILKEMFPGNQVKLAAELQYALHSEGRDLTDDEAYRHLLEKYAVNPDHFYEKLHSEPYREKALYEFALCKQLQVTGFPQVLLQSTDQHFYLLARGYTDEESLEKRLQAVLAELNHSTS